ncbi:hypothetical protein IscW_ISCW012515 [Ixodes scapularis]|uniref:Uncharacterized protein n=1 Tax=Ixodes scapularis TaxID=6945 RepID=B7QBC1_IXOSC|nr:hypothetical protein IscW_ISCW012515 [Ixodes scapularis]|eukprot:XP_002412847.1 hypothetical protein IscW_ISCW012515 [Ixodes scapularis]
MSNCCTRGGREGGVDFVWRRAAALVAPELRPCHQVQHCTQANGEQCPHRRSDINRFSRQDKHVHQTQLPHPGAGHCRVLLVNTSLFHRGDPLHLHPFPRAAGHRHECCHRPRIVFCGVASVHNVYLWQWEKTCATRELVESRALGVQPDLTHTLELSTLV